MPTFVVETYGCQMNVHDSERISGLLLDAGYTQALADTQPDLVVFNTCAVRENADNKLYGNLSFLAPRKKSDPNFQIAVGGCMAQKDQDAIIKRAPYVDVVFGTHNIGSLPILLERARIEEASQVEIKESLEHFPSTLPVKRDSAFSAWVSVSVGCNNTCTFCIVPTLRGIEKDRPASDILREINTLVDSGIIEITLLGQNVNAYGVEFGDRAAFANLLKECGKIAGLASEESDKFDGRAETGKRFELENVHRLDAGNTGIRVSLKQRIENRAGLVAVSSENVALPNVVGALFPSQRGLVKRDVTD